MKTNSAGSRKVGSPMVGSGSAASLYPMDRRTKLQSRMQRHDAGSLRNLLLAVVFLSSEGSRVQPFHGTHGPRRSYFVLDLRGGDGDDRRGSTKDMMEASLAAGLKPFELRCCRCRLTASLARMSNCRIWVDPKTNVPGYPYRQIFFLGTPDEVAQAKLLVKETIEGPDASKGIVKDVLAIPDEWVGAIIGKGGIVLKNIMSATDTRIYIPGESPPDSDSRLISIMGAPANVAEAKTGPS
ncbi:hypothetical protein GUITHDRAFT_109945 [Guillardia theta CCMP2712]|uniref:K Homology domain-containing protein n=1 Tax=Guillardia theta (strain CCMP2712) TaxID=905079 RepID=L1J6J5_GUITC|nr:hypothetical protein GUITHDRAFT_109945 [Guillardia theta CCMP2712]EKX44163.1 hypothetical protein GUITHDRAFT_109945 [Guillardia theta CCMP2712]|eukprot:XP_005831143.1 hypothetical protein GUITHDRAFT_109945 [Guillardia theta CCMP2712]